MLFKPLNGIDTSMIVSKYGQFVLFMTFSEMPQIPLLLCRFNYLNSIN